MNALDQVFWAEQEVYITKIFLPVIIGFFVLGGGLFVLFAASFWGRHYRLWRLGEEDDRSDQVATRLKTLAGIVFASIRFWKELYPGTMHFLIFWGTVFLFLGKTVRLLSYPAGLTNPPQDIFLSASFISEIGGLFIVFGGGMALARRYLVRPDRLDTTADHTLIFIWGFLLIVTGYLIKGYRMAAPGVDIPSGWFSWAPVSYLFSHLFLTFPSPPLNELLIWHRVLIHAILTVIFFAYIIVSRSHLQHIFLSPLNIFFRSLKPRGALSPISDFEEAETFGVSHIRELTWKQLLDLEACTGCGRCQDNCPAYLSKKPLSPKKMTRDLRDHLFSQEKALLAGGAKEETSHAPLVGNVVKEDELWACTTCRSCQEQCPIFVEHIDKVVYIRRNMVLVEGSIPPELEDIFKNMEFYGNPFGMEGDTRGDWAKDLGIKTLEEESNPDILFYVGCSGSFDDRYKKVSVSLANIMKAAGVNFGILGKEEKCCGDSARRAGNEYLYQMLAQENIETFRKYNVKKIVTACPHGYNTLKEEYPQFGGEFEVLHHTEFILGLIKEGKLKLSKKIEGSLTYHDSCYLGRYHDIYDTPREILTGLSRSGLIEMNRNRTKSFCCGAGGGRMWMEEDIGDRINEVRIDDAVRTGSDLVATACPFCLTMMEDGLKAKDKDEAVKVLDISEIVEKAL